jgi:hypothetical protein
MCWPRLRNRKTYPQGAASEPFAIPTMLADKSSKQAAIAVASPDQSRQPEPDRAPSTVGTGVRLAIPNSWARDREQRNEVHASDGELDQQRAMQ